jgi:hypothetical protein
MGGMTALGIMTHHPELKSVACLMGSGYFTKLSQSLFPSPAVSAERLAEWDVTSSSARWPTDRYCSGTAMKMMWCRLKVPSGSSRRCGKTIWILT